MAAGETLHVQSSGGCGYGCPAARDPERVALDVRRGYISRDAARDIYKVAVNEDGTMDAVATETLRAA